MSYTHNFLFLVSDYMAQHTMGELKELDWIKTVNKSRLSQSRLKDFILRALLSIKLNRYFSLPFKKAIYKSILGTDFKESKPLCIVISPPWYNKHLIKYLRNEYKGCKIIINFHDTVKNSIERNPLLSLDAIKSEFDCAVVYNPEDSKEYGFPLCHEGYTPIPVKELEVYPKCDVVFIGAAKDRLNIVRKLYRRFTDAGLNCFFYITEAPQNERLDDGIIYADKPMPFTEYLAREASANCLLEILQKGSTGKTYRMIEAIIYNKKLITNCPEIKNSKYYNQDYVIYFEDEDAVSPEFIKMDVGEIDYKYSGDFSRKAFFEFIDDLMTDSKFIL